MLSVSIIGLDFMGASLGLALKNAYKEKVEISGFDLRRPMAHRAKCLHTVDRCFSGLPEAVSRAEVIIIALPPTGIEEILKNLAHCLPPGCIVNNKSEIKGTIMELAERMLPLESHFIGGHPLPGRAVNDADHPDPDVFAHRPYCLVPAVEASAEALETLVSMVRAIRARPMIIDPQEHDAYVAGSEQLPFLAEIALAAITARSPLWDRTVGLAVSARPERKENPWVQLEVSLRNRQNLARWLDEYIEELKRYQSILASEDEIRAALEEGCRVLDQARQSLSTLGRASQTLNSWDNMGALLVGHRFLEKIKNLLRQKNR